jgi:hypothetical protein
MIIMHKEPGIGKENIEYFDAWFHSLSFIAENPLHI